MVESTAAMLPESGRDYPADLVQFRAWFLTDEACCWIMLTGCVGLRAFVARIVPRRMLWLSRPDTGAGRVESAPPSQPGRSLTRRGSR